MREQNTTRISKRPSPIRPIYFMHTDDITDEERAIGLETLEEIIEIANLRGKIPIIDLGCWRERNYRDDNGNLQPHMSVDWYVTKWRDTRRNQVNILEGARQLLYDPWNFTNPHYDVILTAQDLFTPETNFVVGIAYRGRGTIISVRRFRNIGDKKMEIESKRQEIFHEVGHVFGLPNERRGSDIEYVLGAHCTNICSMRQGLIVPADWIRFANDRLRTGVVYCSQCTKDLKEYFKE